jgi:glycosyltransferase involved in cell wall biosynthesis
MGRTISFVVTARDEAPAVLQETIDGLLATSIGHDREIIVVDDGSRTPVDLVGSDILVLRHALPVGVAQSRRYGASVASGDVLVISDAHMHFSPDWLDHMLAHVDCGALLCAAWWNYEMTRPLCYGAEFLWCGDRDYKKGRVPGFAFRHRTHFPGEGAVEVPMVIGACYMILRESYEKFGGFSPLFRVWGRSEQDISIRAWITGVGLKCVTGARVGHLTRSKFPYPVRFSDIEFNQVAMVRTVFEEPAAHAIEKMLQPHAAQVEQWLSQTDFSQWRQLIQSRRTMSDEEFFGRFIPKAWEHITQSASTSPAGQAACG